MPKQPLPPTGEVILYPTEDGRTRYPWATIRKFRIVRRGLEAANLRQMRPFRQALPIRDALRRELSWQVFPLCDALRRKLSGKHDRILPGVVRQAMNMLPVQPNQIAAFQTDGERGFREPAHGGATSIVFRDGTVADYVAASNLTAVPQPHGPGTVRSL